MLLVCELHVHTDCIPFACSDCRQCHQDGHQDQVSEMPLQQKMITCFWCKNMGWRRWKSFCLFFCMLPIIKALLLLMDRKRKCVASECVMDSKMNWNSNILNMIETVMKSLCNLYNILIKKKKRQKIKHLKICIAEADVEVFFFSICWAVGCIASLANIILFLRLPAVCLRQDGQLPTVKCMHNTDLSGFFFFWRILVLVDHEEKALCDNFFDSLLDFFQWNVRLFAFILVVRKY